VGRQFVHPTYGCIYVFSFCYTSAVSMFVTYEWRVP
jgi:hypothetical protein